MKLFRGNAEGPRVRTPQGGTGPGAALRVGVQRHLGSVSCPSPTPTSLCRSQCSEVPHVPGEAEMHPGVPRGGDVPFAGSSPATAQCCRACQEERVAALRLTNRLSWPHGAGRAPATGGAQHPPGKCTPPGGCAASPAPFLLLSHSVREQFDFFKCSCRQKSGFPLSLQRDGAFTPQGSRRTPACKHRTMP